MYSKFRHEHIGPGFDRFSSFFTPSIIGLEVRTSVSVLENDEHNLINVNAF